MNTENRNEKLVDFARRYGIRGVKRYAPRKRNSFLKMAVFAGLAAGLVFELTVGSVIHLVRGVQVVRR